MPTKEEDILISLDDDLRVYTDYLKKISASLIAEEISKYPIFIAHQEENIQLGRMVIDHNASKTNWSINVSMAEEFVKREIIHLDRFPSFQAAYKDPSQFMCIFIVNKALSRFIFCPYE